MIDSTTEQVISLTDAAKRLPARRGGKRPHVSCIYRWSTDGCRGIVLETLQVGATRCTSVEALQRFFERLSHHNKPEPSPQPTRTPNARRHASERAARELEALGV
ncbi:DUF1580 domain-containing protein [bacterium]|nr:DUF1580 domain-containing protein [bacterium]